MKVNQMSLSMNLPLFSIGFDFINNGDEDAELMVDFFSMYDILSNYHSRMDRKIAYKSYDSSSEPFDKDFFYSLDKEDAVSLMYENINLIIEAIEDLSKCVFHCKKFIEYCIKHKSNDLYILKNVLDEIKIHLLDIEDEGLDNNEFGSFIINVHKYMVLLFNKVNDLIVKTTRFPKK